MNANEARKLTETNLKTVVIDNYVLQVEQRIREAATAGRNTLIDPFINLKDPDTPGSVNIISGEIKDALVMHFRANGFKFVERPDPGHPESRRYGILSW
jgi:hypothetical protein